MKTITKFEYDRLLSKVPQHLKEQIQSQAIPEQWSFIGCDFSGQENVNLSELLLPYDNGRLDDIINNGDKDNGTDLHSLNAKICGVSRGDAKAIWFGKLYGSSSTLTGFTILGNKPYDDYTDTEYTDMETKLAKRIVYIEADPNTPYYPIKKGQLVKFTPQLIKQALFGQNIQTKLEESTEGLKELEEQLKKEVNDTGGVTLRFGNYNRFIPADSDHKALNYACQGLGGIAMKEYLKVIHSNFAKANLLPGRDFRLQAVIYDEVDLIARSRYKLTIRDILLSSFEQVSRNLGMTTTYTGECLIGGYENHKGHLSPNSWAGCH